MSRPTETEFTYQFGRFLMANRAVWRPRTWELYGQVFRRNLAPRFKGQSVSTITPADLQVVVNQPDHAPATRRLTRCLLTRFFNWLIENDLAYKNPAAKVRSARAEPPVVMPLTPDEARAVLTAARQDWAKYTYPFIGIAIYTGLRRQNILTLGPEQIFTDYISIPGSMMKTGNPLTVPFRAELKPLLSQCPLNCDRHSIRRAFERVAVASGVARLRPHLLRHTFGSWLLRYGAPYPVISKLMGHRRIDSSVTAVYTHVDMDQMREALAKLPMLL